MEPYNSFTNSNQNARNCNNRMSNPSMNRGRAAGSCNQVNGSNRYPDYDCDRDNDGEFLNLNKMPIAMAYVPMQEWGALYKAEQAICEGTAFPELNRIFCGVRGR